MSQPAFRARDLVQLCESAARLRAAARAEDDYEAESLALEMYALARAHIGAMTPAAAPAPAITTHSSPPRFVAGPDAFVTPAPKSKRARASASAAASVNVAAATPAPKSSAARKLTFTEVDTATAAPVGMRTRTRTRKPVVVPRAMRFSPGDEDEDVLGESTTASATSSVRRSFRRARDARDARDGRASGYDSSDGFVVDDDVDVDDERRA